MATKEQVRIRFKTRVTEDGKTAPAGREYTLDKERAEAYIQRGLAEAVEGTGKKPREATPTRAAAAPTGKTAAPTDNTAAPIDVGK